MADYHRCLEFNLYIPSLIQKGRKNDLKPVFSETAPNEDEKATEFLKLDDNNPIKWEYTTAVGDRVLIAIKSSNLGDEYLSAIGKK